MVARAVSGIRHERLDRRANVVAIRLTCSPKGIGSGEAGFDYSAPCEQQVDHGPSPARVAAAPTVPREVRAFAAQAFDPAWAAKISVPVLLLVGSESPADIRADPEIVARSLPDARIVMLEGQAHMAHLTDPESFAAAVVSFLSSGSR